MNGDKAYLSNDKDMIKFQYGDKIIRFRGAYSLERFTATGTCLSTSNRTRTGQIGRITLRLTLDLQTQQRQLSSKSHHGMKFSSGGNITRASQGWKLF